jgi:hypothetical protein
MFNFVKDDIITGFHIAQHNTAIPTQIKALIFAILIRKPTSEHMSYRLGLS